MGQAKVKREKTLHRRAFNKYFDMGPSRSLPRVADHFGVSIAAAKQWSRSHGWKARVKARDEENSELQPVDVGLDKKTVKEVDEVASMVSGGTRQIKESTQDGAGKALDIPRDKKGKPKERNRDNENLALIDGLKVGAAKAISRGILSVDTVADLATLIRAEGYVTRRDSESFVNKEAKPFVMIQTLVKNMHIDARAVGEKALRAVRGSKDDGVIEADSVEVLPEGRPTEVEPGRPDRPLMLVKKKSRQKKPSS